MKLCRYQKWYNQIESIYTIYKYLDHDMGGLRLDIMNPADKDGDYVNISLFE